MKLVRGLLVGIVVASGSSAFGFAASALVVPGTIGAGFVAVVPCTTASLGVLPNLSGSNVVSVTVSGLPPSCGAATLLVTVNNGSANSGGSATVPAAGGAVTVAIAAGIAVATRLETDLVLVGP